jgi:heptosyltransferase-3
MKKALLIKSKNLGDSVILTSSIVALSKNYLIDVYCKEDSVQIFRNCNYVNQIFFDSKDVNFLRRILNYIKSLKKIKDNRYDLLVSFGDDWRGAVIARWGGVGFSVCRHSRKRGRFWKSSFDLLAKNSDSRRHAAEQDVDLLRVAGLYAEPIAPTYKLNVQDQALEQVKRAFTALSNRNTIVIHATSRWKFKEISNHVWSRLIDKLIKDGFDVALSGSESDYAQNCEIVKNIHSEKIFVAQSFSIDQTLALYSMAKCLISIDSMAVHAASALGIPVVAIFGPTNEDNWRPWRVHHRVVTADVHLDGFSFSCRPCGLDGCGGSKTSYCLRIIDEERIYTNLLALLEEVS